MEAKFYQRLKLANPDETIVYFWPDTPISLLKKAKELGFTCVREMINNPCEAAKTILDDAYLAQNLPPTHPVTQIKVQTENDEIEYYDYFFSSNDEVDRALIEKGIAPQKILKASFGWDVGRFEGSPPAFALSMWSR